MEKKNENFSSNRRDKCKRLLVDRLKRTTYELKKTIKDVSEASIKLSLVSAVMPLGKSVREGKFTRAFRQQERKRTLVLVRVHTALENWVRNCEDPAHRRHTWSIDNRLWTGKTCRVTPIKKAWDLTRGRN